MSNFVLKWSEGAYDLLRDRYALPKVWNLKGELLAELKRHQDAIGLKIIFQLIQKPESVSRCANRKHLHQLRRSRLVLDLLSSERSWFIVHGSWTTQRFPNEP